MAEYPAMPLLTDAYLADTMHLSNEEHGAYLRLLIIAWRTQDCSLPDDDKRLATMLGVTVKRWRDKLRPIIAPFWRIDGGKWTQKKQLEVRQKVEKNVQQKRNAVAERERLKSLRNNNSSRSVDTSDDKPPDVSTKTKDSKLESDSTSESKIQDSGSHPNLCSADANAPPERGEAKSRRKFDFDEWWSGWSISKTKRSKLAAEKQYRAVIRSGRATHADLCAGLARSVADWRRRAVPLDKIVHPDRWLENGRWLDELSDETEQENQHDHRRNGALSSNAELAERILRQQQRDRELRESGSDASGVHVLGQGDQSDRPPGPGHGDSGDGRGVPEFPALGHSGRG